MFGELSKFPEHFTIFREGNTKCSPLFVYKSFISGYGLLINDFALLIRVIFALVTLSRLWINVCCVQLIHNVLCINESNC